MPKYLGPGDVLEYKGTYYRKGDNVPMTKEEIEHHVVYAGQRFDGYDQFSGVAAPIQPAAQPFDDRGQQLVMKEDDKPSKAEVPDNATVVVTPPAVVTKE